MAQADIDTLAISANNASTDDLYHFAVRVDGDWFATATSFGVATGGAADDFPTNGERLEYTFNGGPDEWRRVAFVPGTTSGGGTLMFATTPAQDLPMGDIEAFGLYTDGNVGTLRFDNYEINAVPEPAMLGSLSLLGLAAMRRRRA